MFMCSGGKQVSIHILEAHNQSYQTNVKQSVKVHFINGKVTSKYIVKNVCQKLYVQFSAKAKSNCTNYFQSSCCRGYSRHVGICTANIISSVLIRYFCFRMQACVFFVTYRGIFYYNTKMRLCVLLIKTLSKTQTNARQNSSEVLEISALSTN